MLLLVVFPNSLQARKAKNLNLKKSFKSLKHREAKNVYLKKEEEEHSTEQKVLKICERTLRSG